MNTNILTNENNENILSFKFKSIYYKIPLRSIIYIESSGRKCFVHTTSNLQNSSNEEMTFYGKLDELSEMLSSYGFARCHQSYLVSIQHADKYHNKFIYLHRKTIPVSDRYRTAIINIFNNSNITPNLTSTISTIGVLVCINGEYKGSIIRIYPNIDYELGRDGNECEIIINLPYISRKHCTLTYNSNGSFAITDHSHNGTYQIEDDGFARKLTTNKIETLQSGSVICFGDRNLQYRII